MNILMTGCSRSVGQYISEQLKDQGHQVFGIGLGGPDYSYDLTDVDLLDSDVEDIFDSAEEEFGGPVHVLVNNAAMTQIDFMEHHSLEDFLKVSNINMAAPFILTREFVRRTILEQVDSYNPATYSGPFKRVISTSSMGTKTSLRASPGYCASKAGIEALTKMWAREFSNKLPIITAAIAPAGIDGTAMKDQCIDDLQRTRGMTEEEATKYFTQAPLGRNCTFDEVWKLFNFAINDMPVYCSGEVFYMTGGTGL
jgi:3-oxoacyl-[acyl-carrier protein] reductase